MICCNTYEKLFFVFLLGFFVCFKYWYWSTTFFAWLGFLVLNLGSTKDYCGVLLRILDCEARQPSTTRHAFKCLSDPSIRDHPFKTSANFHNVWPLPPYHRHSSKMLMKGIFYPYVLWPFDHRHMGTPLPP